MEKSKLYDLLDSGLLHEWRESIEKEEGESWFFTREKEALKKLEPELNEKDKKLLAEYAIAVEGRMDYLYYNITIKVLNFGINIGLELQKAFSEYELS